MSARLCLRLGLEALLFLALAAPAAANVPSAYLACAGAADGDRCTLVGPTHGRCILDTLCTPNRDLAVNNCLLCVDPCWGQADNTACILRDGTDGVCALQDRCTDDPFKSFSECNRCVAGAVRVEAARSDEEEGCAAGPLGPVTWRGWGPWALLALGLGAGRLRRLRRGAARPRS